MSATSIRELAELHWNGEGDLAGAQHPVFPIANRAGEEIKDGIFYLKSVASVTALDSGDGLVLLDTGGPFDSDIVFDSIRGWRPRARLSAAVFSHHHIDHVFGTARFEEEAAGRGWIPPRVYGHSAMAENFERYERTLDWNAAINRRQFALGAGDLTWPSRWRRPDIVYDERLTFAQGELTFELHHARGETDDATWTWVPERRLLHPGDLFIYAVPNAGNPQKVQRYLSDWATALREMDALDAEVLVSGHGLPVFGAGRVHVALSDTADLLDAIEDQTLELMNTGCSLDGAIHQVTVPEHLRDRPYLRAVYDHPQFLVRNVWRRYGGWYDGEPDNLLPAPRADQAREWVTLAGGVEEVIARAEVLTDAGELRLACHLVEAAVLAEPGSTRAHAARAAIYESRAALEESSMARNILRHAALSSREHKRDLAGDF